MTRPVIVCAESASGNVRAIASSADPRHARACTWPSSLTQEDAELLGREQPLAAFEDLVEHRRRVGDGAADHLQHFGGRGLLLERFLVSLNRRAFWIAITAWSANVLQQRDLLVARMALAGARATAITPMPRSSRSSGTHSDDSVAQPLRADHVAYRGQVARRSESGKWRIVAARRIAAPVIAVARRASERKALRGTRRDPRAQCARDVEQPSSLDAAQMPTLRRREQVLAALDDRVEHRRASASEPLITRRTSAVAVCCSSASWVSLNRRAFWIAITAWSAKVLSSAMSWSENAPA